MTHIWKDHITGRDVLDIETDEGTRFQAFSTTYGVFVGWKPKGSDRWTYFSEENCTIREFYARLIKGGE